MSSNNKSINSPIRYAGGKFYARKLILEHIPFHTKFIEPFAGGASVFFAKPKVEFNLLNDLDWELINLFKIIRDFPQDLINFLTFSRQNSKNFPSELIEGLKLGEPLPATKELHHFFKNDYNPITELEKAGRWFYLNNIL